jgi:antitoxin component of MazEF toxin-antitoxin module
MKDQVQKRGNTPALRIPKNFALETDIENGSTVDVAVQKGAIKKVEDFYNFSKMS